MKKINLILSLLSLNAVFISIERFSITTDIILPPYHFLRLHEVVQISVLILLSTILAFFLLKEISGNFELLRTHKGTILGALFIVGVYFSSTGNGLHEVASYFFNTFCNSKVIENLSCGSMYFNDYYFGNILYFMGLFFTNLSLILLEIMRPNKSYTKKDFSINIINSLILGCMFFAYAAFDKVLVGLFFTIFAAVTTDIILLMSKRKFLSLPFTSYCAMAYTIAAIGSTLVRFH
jgi:hypothetical protein